MVEQAAHTAEAEAEAEVAGTAVASDIAVASDTVALVGKQGWLEWQGVGSKWAEGQQASGRTVGSVQQLVCTLTVVWAVAWAPGMAGCRSWSAGGAGQYIQLVRAWDHIQLGKSWSMGCS